MNRVFSVRVFSLVFAIVYTVTSVYNWPLFRYYPLVKRFSLSDLADKSLGPAMSWYGWMAYAALIAAVAALIVPKRWGDRLWIGLFWLAPFLMLAGSLYCERQWFLR